MTAVALFSLYGEHHIHFLARRTTFRLVIVTQPSARGIAFNMWGLWNFGPLLSLLLLSITVQAAPVVPDTPDSHNSIVTTIEVGDGSPKVEIHIIEVVKTVTETEKMCAHTTGLKTGAALSLETPIPTITSVHAERTSTTHQKVPAATSLIPAVHWDVDVHRMENLQANKSVDMFYCEHKLERTEGKAIRM